MPRSFVVASGLACLMLLVTGGRFVAAEEMSFADDKLVLQVPEGWKKKMPKVRIIDHECEIPVAEGDEIPGRMTIMGAGGSVEDNITRWVGQFEQPDGSDTKEKVKRSELSIAGQKVFYVDIGGTYKDSPGGPFAGGAVIRREKYRMLGAIITTEKLGQYFVKFYGPQKTVDANEEAFKKMVDGLKVNK